MKFKTEKEFMKKVKFLKGELYLVGGAVRDKQLSLTPKDKDYMITGLSPKDIPFSKIVGDKFPVYLVKVGDDTVEVALARTESKVSQGHKGFTFTADSSVSLEDDLMRRDLTINAMAIHVETGKLHDPFFGKDDLDKKVLRHTSPAFAEDPLRVFRVARFASRLDFEVAVETKELMKQMSAELKTLSGERVWIETEKALETDRTSVYFKTLFEVDALDYFFAELKALDVPDKHDGTAFLHTMTVLDFGESPQEKFGLLVHDFGKGVTPKEDHPSHHGHDKLGLEEIDRFADRLRVPKSYKSFGKLSSSHHMRLKRSTEMRFGKFLRMVLELGTKFEKVWRVSFIDSIHREGADKEFELATFLDVLHKARLVFKASQEVTGKHLIEEGRKPSPYFKDHLVQARVKKYKELQTK